MAKVFVTREIYREGLDVLERGVSEVRVWHRDEQIPRDVLLRQVADCDGILTLLTGAPRRGALGRRAR